MAGSIVFETIVPVLSEALLHLIGLPVFSEALLHLTGLPVFSEALLRLLGLPVLSEALLGLLGLPERDPPLPAPDPDRVRHVLPFSHRHAPAPRGAHGTAGYGRPRLGFPGPQHSNLQGRRLLLHLPVGGDCRHAYGSQVKMER